MFNSITTKNLPQTKIVTKYSIDEASLEQLALDAAATCKDAVRGLRGKGGVIYSYIGAAVTPRRVFAPSSRKSVQTIPQNKIDYYDGEEWFYVEPETYSPCLSDLKLDPNSLSWSEPILSEKETVGYIDAFKEVELTFARGSETKTKKVYVEVSAPISEQSETSIRVKKWSGSCVSVTNATCEDFEEFEIGQTPINQINCGNGYIIIKNKHEAGSAAPNNESRIVRSSAGLECEKWLCCASCEDFYNSFEDLLSATQVRDSDFQGYSIAQVNIEQGQIGQNLNAACENLTCYQLVAPAIPIY
jgi:hypothetical protein